MKIHPFVRDLAELNFPNVFNPYHDQCMVYDRVDAPVRRSKILSKIVQMGSESSVDAIWIGRDLGYRGGRRTGMALTDDVHLACHASRWGIRAERPTIGPAVAERTAAVIWSMLNRIDERIFLWNVFPLHPHEEGNPFSNRQHNSVERAAGEAILASLVVLLRPRRILAIGNDATAVASRIAPHRSVLNVRHPSYGGQTQFLRQIAELYSLVPEKQLLL